MAVSDFPAWTSVVLTIGECSKRLPDDCDRDFMLASLHALAEVIVDARNVLTEYQQGVLVGVGALVMRQVANETEARLMAGDVIERARNGGAA